MIDIRRLEPSEAIQISEIDRTQHITQDYVVEGGALVIKDVDWHIGQWDAQQKIREWSSISEDYRNMWGAFEESRLVGFAVYRANFTTDSAQFALLHISRPYRGKGIGKNLCDVVLQKARSDEKKQIYVTATPAKTTVDFYMRMGFRLADPVNAELYELEPEDIHLIMDLS